MRVADNFEIAFGITDAHEGDWCNVPGDRGGETWRAVARKAQPYWPGWALVDAAKVGLSGMPGSKGWIAELNARLAENAELEDLRAELFRSAYWSPLRLDDIALLPSLVAYDTSINSGPVAAGKLLQRSINICAASPVLTVDGKIGPATLGGAQACDPLALALTMCGLRGGLYLRIDGETFDDGWANRNDAMIATVHKLARQTAGEEWK